MYLWRDTPAGNVCLVSGPSVDGTIYELHEHTGGKHGSVYFPGSKGKPALSDAKDQGGTLKVNITDFDSPMISMRNMKVHGWGAFDSRIGDQRDWTSEKANALLIGDVIEGRKPAAWVAIAGNWTWRGGAKAKKALAKKVYEGARNAGLTVSEMTVSGDPESMGGYYFIAAYETPVDEAFDLNKWAITWGTYGVPAPVVQRMKNQILQAGTLFNLAVFAEHLEDTGPINIERLPIIGLALGFPLSETAKILRNHNLLGKRKNPQARVGKVRTDKKTGKDYVLWRPVLEDGSRPRIYLDASPKNMDAELVDVIEAKEQLKSSKKIIERKEKEARSKGLRGIWKSGTGRKIFSTPSKPKQMLRSSSATPLFDSEGDEYRATYAVIATQDNGTGPVMASNLPESFVETSEYPRVFQARSLQRMGEKQKIRKIAKSLDADRLLLPHSDATLGAPVVWEGDGKTHKVGQSVVSTPKGSFYVLGGNGRTIALLMAPTKRYQSYVQRAKALWPDVWPAGGSPDGTRNILVRVATNADGSALTFSQARTLAGRTQKSASGEESPIGKAISLIRSLGIESVSDLPRFMWKGIVTQDNVEEFVAENPAYANAVFRSMGAARAESYQQDAGLLADLFNDLMVGYLPRRFQVEGFVSEKQERALLAALPILLSIQAGVQDQAVQAKWDLFALLNPALRFAQEIKNKSDKQAVAMVERAARQVQIGEGTAQAKKFQGLFDELPILAVLFGIVLKKAEKSRDPAITVEKYLTPYAEEAFASPSARSVGMFGGGAPDPGKDPAMVLGAELNIQLPTRIRETEVPQTQMIANPKLPEPGDRVAYSQWYEQGGMLEHPKGFGGWQRTMGTVEQVRKKIRPKIGEENRIEVQVTSDFDGRKRWMDRGQISSIRPTIQSRMFNPATSRIPPATVALEAKKALQIRSQLSKNKRAGTAVGLSRANQLAARRPVSQNTLKRMVSFFARHDGKVERAARKRDSKSKAAQAWGLWGGNPGRQWAKKELKTFDSPRKNRKGQLRVGRAASRILERLYLRGTTGYAANKDGKFPAGIDELVNKGLALQETCIPGSETLYGTDTCTLKLTKRGQEFAKNRRRAERTHAAARQGRMFNPPQLSLTGIYESQISEAGSLILDTLRRTGPSLFSADEDGNFAPGVQEVLQKGMADQLKFERAEDTLFRRDALTIDLNSRGRRFIRDRKGAAGQELDKAQQRLFNPFGPVKGSPKGRGSWTKGRPPGTFSSWQEYDQWKLKSLNRAITETKMLIEKIGPERADFPGGANAQLEDYLKKRIELIALIDESTEKKKIRRTNSSTQLRLGLLGSIPVLHFASGSNHPGEIRGFADFGKAVGAAISGTSKRKSDGSMRWYRLCRQDCIDELVRATQKGIPVFLDSGAFSEVAPTKTPGVFRVVAPITPSMWKERLSVYQELAEKAGPMANVVAPDMVGFQEQSFQRLKKYAPEVRELIRTGANVLVPLQKGSLSLAEAYKKAAQILGSEDWVPALPFKMAATTPAELELFLAEIKPRRVHLLGVGPRTSKAKSNALANAIRRGSPGTQVQMDSVAITAHSAREKGKPPRRVTAAQDVARERLRQERYQGYEIAARPDYTDLVSSPSEWASPASLGRLAKAGKLTKSEKVQLLNDPDAFFQSIPKGQEDPFYLTMEPQIESEFAKAAHKFETYETKRAGVREGLRELYEQPSFLRNKKSSLFERVGSFGAPVEGEKGFRPPTQKANAFGGETTFNLADRLLGNALYMMDEPEMYWAYCAEVPQDCEGQAAMDEYDAIESLADLLDVPKVGGSGENLNEQERTQIALAVTKVAMETDENRWVGMEIPIGVFKSRKGSSVVKFAPRSASGNGKTADYGAVPKWAGRVVLTDWFASMVPGKPVLRIVNVDKRTAARFIETHHSALPYLNPRGLLFALGLMKGDRLVAVATANTPSGRWDQEPRVQRGELDPQNIVELSRVASDGTTKGASSKLVSRIIDVMDRAKRGDPDAPSLLVTYQLATESGATYKGLQEKGLRPVSYREGGEPSGARAGGKQGEDAALARADKIRWECCDTPPALRGDWSLVREKQRTLFNPLGSIWNPSKQSAIRVNKNTDAPMEPITFMFDGGKFSAATASKWMKHRGIATQSAPKARKLILIDSMDRSKIRRHTLRRIIVDEGVSAIVGVPRSE